MKDKIDSKGQKAVYEYDDAGRLVTIKYYEMAVDADPAKTVSFTYNKNGELTGYNDGTTSAVYIYDSLGRKTDETLNYGSFSLSSAYEYYANGLKKSFTNADNVKYTYTYDAGNRLSGINIPGTGDIIYNEYEWAMPKKITLPGGTVKTFEYDPLMQVKGIMVKDPADNILMNYSYTRDKEGNILSKISNVGAGLQPAQSSYQYDKTYQLLKTIYPDKSETFTYDLAGNRESMSLRGAEGDVAISSYTHNANNEMLSAVIASEAKQSLFEFDSNGNMVKKVDGANTFEYVYNLENRLAEVKLNGHTLATYSYDPFGRRLKKAVIATHSEANGEAISTYFFYTDEGLTAEINASGEVVKTYGFTPNSIWTTDPLWTREGGQYYFYHNDHLATPQMITSSNGTIVWSADYESFGKATVGTETITNNLRFPGQYFDGETGLHQNWHREYSPETGRYGQTDPIGFDSDDENIFRYAFNNSANLKDYNGLYVWICSRKLGNKHKPKASYNDEFRHDYLNVSGTYLGFQAGSNKLWSQGWLEKGKDTEERGSGKCHTLVCDDDKFDKYVFEAAQYEPKYNITAIEGSLQYLLGARNCQSWVRSVLRKAKEEYLKNEKCPKCFKN